MAVRVSQSSHLPSFTALVAASSKVVARRCGEAEDRVVRWGTTMPAPATAGRPRPTIAVGGGGLICGRPGEGYVMRTSRWLSAVAVLVVAGGAGACTGHGGPPPHRSTTTTAPGPIPVDGWAITGITENQFCAGPT